MVLGPELESWKYCCRRKDPKIPEKVLMWRLQDAKIAPCIARGHLAATITIRVDPGVIQRGKLHPIQSDLRSREGGLHLSNLERVNLRWVLVL
jgi:hypothetical protein